MTTIKDVVDFESLRPPKLTQDEVLRSILKDAAKPKLPQKSVKRVLFKTKQVGKSAKPAAYNQIVTTILSEEKKKEQRMYLLALENLKLRKQAFATKKIWCMMCAMNCDSEEELKLHEQKVHWKEDEASFLLLPY